MADSSACSSARNAAISPPASLRASRTASSRYTSGIRNHHSSVYDNMGVMPTGHYERLPRKYQADHSFFDEINTQEKAYWLGFIGADGCVRMHVNSPRLEMCLAPKDADHLRLLRTALRSTHKVTAAKTSCRFAICSRRLFDGLGKHGVHPRKTLTYRWPDSLSPELLRHFVRGYFDGDGSFSMTTRNQVVASVVGTEQFLMGLRSYLIRTLGFPENRLRWQTAAPRLSYGGNKQMVRFAHLLYDDATVYLNRKRERVAHLL